ncbi:hypothetical protein [Amycolatopsis azurea]|uniref:Uncharacterized protein n=1 Tax=Amycolatopsis azurea DSM 43854 TaxID=1238180 RepID=A0ABX3JJR9_9PSEU|nr:hypothetical protein [Amycolatopsis azurea]OOC07550.1 hypothetical protein B0293_07735 [Amycolatopsis azurea DSM 43854]
MRDEEFQALCERISRPDHAYTRRVAEDHLAGVTGPLPQPPPSRVQRRELQQPDTQDDGFIFSRREERQRELDADHRLRRRRADAEVNARENVHSRLRDWYGPEAADRWMP